MTRDARHHTMLIGIVAGALLGLAASELVFAGYVETKTVGYVIDYVAFPVGQIFLRLLFMLAVVGVVLAVNAVLSYRGALCFPMQNCTQPLQSRQPAMPTAERLSLFGQHIPTCLEPLCGRKRV